MITMVINYLLNGIILQVTGWQYILRIGKNPNLNLYLSYCYWVGGISKANLYLPKFTTNRGQPLRIGPQVFNLGSLERVPYIPNTKTYSLKRGLVPVIQFLKQYLGCRKPSNTKENSYELPIYCLLVAGSRHQSLGELVRIAPHMQQPLPFNKAPKEYLVGPKV